MSRLRSVPLALMVLLLTRPAAAQVLALQPVIAAALDHGSKIAHADIKLSLAQGQAQQASGAFDWQANARYGWSRLYYPRVTNVPGVGEVLTNDLQNSWNQQITAGATKLFRNGIQVQPGITFYPGSNASQAQTFGLTRPVPNLNIQIPLTQGLGENNLAAANERASQEEVGGAEMERRAALQQAAMEAAQTYWRCLAAAEDQTLLAANRQASQTYIESLRQLMAAGQISPLALEQALSADAARARQLDQIRSEGSKCRASLAVLLNRDSDMAFPSLATAFPNMDDLSSSAGPVRETLLIETALRQRPDLHALEQYVAAAGERLTAARNERDPKVNLVLDPNGFFVNFAYSLEGNAAKGGEGSAAAKAADASLNLAELKDQIRRDISQGVAALRSSLAALADRRQSQQTLTKVVEDAQHAVLTGGMDRATLRALEDQRTDAAILLVESRLDYALNLAALRLVTGTLPVEGEGAASQDAGLFLSAKF